MTFGSTWNDYDRDGDPDLFVSRHWKRPWLYDKVGRSYRIATHDFVPRAIVDRHGCSWGEANGDGRPDLYCTRGADRGLGTGRNQLWLQRRHGFVERAGAFGVGDRLGRGRTANWLDYDTDGDLDLFVTNGFRKGAPSVMFENTRRGFRRVDVGIGHQVASAWPSSSWADWDADGDPDVLVVGRRSKAAAYENTGSRFHSTTLVGISGQTWRSSAWGDYDGDGLPDVFLVKAKVAVIARNRGAGRFDITKRLNVARPRMGAWLDIENDGDLDLFVVQGALGQRPETGSRNHHDFVVLNTRRGFRKVRHRSFRGPRGGNGDTVVASDHDRDGRVDVFVTNGHNPWAWAGRSALLENRSRARNWVGLRLFAGRWNPWGFDARISVTTRRRSYERQLTDGVSYRGQNDVSYVHLGIGRARRARIEVRWPTGGRACIRIAAGRTRRVTRSQHGCG